MKGKVLGFDAAAGTGVINGEDGKRYAYTAADNKSPNPTRPNDDVDFVADGDNAKDIFVIMAAPAAAAPASIDFSGLASDPNVKNILAKPTIIWAALVILGALIAGYINAFSMMNIGGASFLYILLFALPIVAGVQIYFELTNSPHVVLGRLVTGAAAVALPILVPVIVGGGTLGVLGSFGGDWFGFNITFPKILMVGGGVLILLTHFDVIKKLG